MTRLARLVLLALVCTLVVSTGAAVLEPDGSDRDRDRLSGDVVAYPDPGPNGAYAVLEDGDLAIEFTDENPAVDGGGVPAGAVTGVDDVFRLESAGDAAVDVWLESGDDRLGYYTDEGSIEGKENATTLGPRESVSVGVSVDAAALDAGERVVDPFEIRATEVPPADLPDDPVVPATRVVVSGEGGLRHVEVTDARPFDAVEIDLRALAIGNAITFESVSLETASLADVAFDVEAVQGPVGAADPPPELGALPDDVGATPLGSVALDGPSGPEGVDLAYAVSVDRTALAGRDPGAVSLYRHAGDEWAAVETEVVSETDDAVVYSGPLEGSATYAVGIDAPASASDRTAGGPDGRVDSGGAERHGSVEEPVEPTGEGVDDAVVAGGLLVATAALALLWVARDGT